MILPAVFHRFEAKAGSIHAGVLRALFWRHLFKFMGEFHQASLFSFRRPQCVSFPVESTPRTWSRFNACMTPIRAARHKGGRRRRTGGPPALGGFIDPEAIFAGTIKPAR